MKLFFIFSLLLFTRQIGAVELNLKFDSNVSSSLRKQVSDDFELMGSIAGFQQSPLHLEIFGNLDGKGYLQWFTDRVSFFGYSNCGGPSAVACVNGKYKNKIFVTGNYTRISHPQIARLMTLYHEGRHTEFDHGMWPHAKCPSQFPYRSIWTGKKLAGNYACDATVYGSYASASVLLNNISRFCQNCSEKMKEDAKIYSDDQVKRVIDLSSAERLKQDFSN